jgi:hypothetical protein
MSFTSPDTLFYMLQIIRDVYLNIFCRQRSLILANARPNFLWNRLTNDGFLGIGKIDLPQLKLYLRKRNAHDGMTERPMIVATEKRQQKRAISVLQL